jgi:hypothetical protein
MESAPFSLQFLPSIGRRNTHIAQISSIVQVLQLAAGDATQLGGERAHDPAVPVIEQVFCGER